MNIPFKGYLRHRDSREAADTGLLIWRENFPFFILFFAVPFWICAFALRLLPGNAQYFSWLILWYLKPLFDRPVLHIISVRFFENGADFKRLFNGLGKSLWKGLPGDLLWRRFSPLRSAMMPVRVLEPEKKLTRETENRKKFLVDYGLGYCFFLSLWGIALEITLLIGEILFFISIIEIFNAGYISSLGDFFINAEIFIFTAWCFNYMLVETIYVCMGFSLYINSRVEVEGWDIEIIFRSFAEKLKKKNISVILLVFIVTFMILPVNVSAADQETTVNGSNVPIEKLQNILDSSDFGGEKDFFGIRLKNPPETGEIPDINLNPMLEGLRFVFAFILRLIIIVLIAALAVILYLYIRKNIYAKNPLTKKPAIRIMDRIINENPEALLEKSIIFFEQKNLRLAWGFCTAAAITSWSLYRGLSFPRNATENECANMVNAITPCSKNSRDEIQSFCTVINYWVNFAYAGQLPPDGSFEQAAAFCKSLSSSPKEDRLQRSRQ